MKQTFTYRQKAREMLIVLLPIFITQLALMSTGFFDTIMAGHVSEQDLAGVAVGVNLFYPFWGSCLGIISGLTPVLANLYGAGKHEKIAFIVQQGFYWSLVLAGVFIVLGLMAVPILLPMLGLEPRVEYVVQYYLLAMAYGVGPIFLAGVLRNLIDALGATRITMGITVVTVPINIGLNYIFIYGAFGVPALGGIGAGVGTAIAFYINLFLNLLVVSRLQPFKSYKVLHSLPRPLLSDWRKQLSVGIPIGCTMFCEQSIFGAVGLFMTVYGTAVVAAHQAALNFTTMAYMIPLSVSMSLTILVGYELGAGRQLDARRYSRLGRMISLVFASSLAAVLVNFRGAIAGLYTNDPVVQEYIIVFLLYAIGMQLSDGLNAPLQGTLRGYKDVRVTFFLAVLSFWIIGLPAGWLLAHYTAVGPYGYWIGLISGILAGAVLLTLRLRTIERRYEAQAVGRASS